MEKDFNAGLRRSLESDRIKLTRRRKHLLREMGLSEDLDSTELAEKLYEQTRANDVLNRNLVLRDEEIAKYQAENTSLRERIAELEMHLGCDRYLLLHVLKQKKQKGYTAKPFRNDVYFFCLLDANLLKIIHIINKRNWQFLPETEDFRVPLLQKI